MEIHHTTRPRDPAERDTCIDAAARIVADTSLSLRPSTHTLLDQDFVAARDGYLAARTAWRNATAAEDAAQIAAGTASSAFDATWRLWSGSVRDPDGKAVPREISKLIAGILPGDLVKRSNREKVTLTSDLLTQVAANPSIAGDAARLTDLTAAHLALKAATAAEEAAEKARATTSTVLTSAEGAFDGTWGDVVRALKKAGPEVAAMLPQFVVSAGDPATATTAPAETAPVDAAAEPVS